jgi:hypothetical protein
VHVGRTISDVFIISSSSFITFFVLFHENSTLFNENLVTFGMLIVCPTIKTIDIQIPVQ